MKTETPITEAATKTTDWFTGEPVVPSREMESLERENARLREALASIAEMPEYDQDDAHRLRNIAKVSLSNVSGEPR